MKPLFFPTSAKLRVWLRKHHRKETELWLGFYKKASGKATVTYHEALDEALCFGWIDGVRKSLDEESFVQRFTPRRKGSVWSAVNIKKVAGLTAAKRMHAWGQKVFDERDLKKAGLYSFEQTQAITLSPADVKRFKLDRAAWAFYEALPPGYRRTITWYVVSAKRPETRERRLAKLIEASTAGRRL